MDATAAIEAGKLGQAINDLERVIKLCQEHIDGGSFFTGKASIQDPVQGRDWIEFPAMSKEESAGFFGAACSVFKARLDTLNQQLSAL